jgi:hypothetical protein
VDATNREQLRINRAERHFTAKATTWAIVGGLAAAVLGAWAESAFGLLPLR